MPSADGGPRNARMPPAAARGFALPAIPQHTRDGMASFGAGLDAGDGEKMNFLQIFDLTNEFNILRLICGLFLLPHLFAKVTDLPFTYKIYDDYRLYPVKLWVFACITVEVICSIGMVFATPYPLCGAGRGGVSAGRRLGDLAPQCRQMALADWRFRILPVLGDLLRRRRDARLNGPPRQASAAH